MKLDLQFEQNQQNINVHFSEDEEQINANFGEISVIHGGQDGATFIPSVSDDGIISWTNDRDLPNPKPVNIKGEKGDSGVTSWNDLEDKPFGEGETSWVQVGTNPLSSGSATMLFTATAGKKYKIEVVDTFDNTVVASNIAPCLTSPMMGYLYYSIGETTDDVHGNGGISNTQWTFQTKVIAPFGVAQLYIYEESETVTTLDEKYLPDSVVLESELDAKGYQTEEQVKALIDDSITGSDSTFEMPIFNLAEMGMSTHTVGGETTSLSADVSHIIEAMRKGLVGFIIPTNYGNVTVYSPTMEAGGTPEAVCAFWLATPGAILWGDVAIACTSNNSLVVASMFRTTEQQVTELINNALGVIENGTY